MRTIRSAARSRNRGTPGLAWIAVLALTLLALLVARVSAEPGDRGRGARGDALAAEGDRTAPALDSVEDVDRGLGELDLEASTADEEHDAAELDVDEPPTELGVVLDAEDGLADGWLLHDPDALSLDAAEVAAFDDPEVRDEIEAGMAFTSAAFADASELEDLALRHQRPSRWGRFDLTVAWRRVWTPPRVTVNLGPLPHGPMVERHDTADTVLVLATWSR